MMLNMFENMLQGIANDKALMSYGNNDSVVNSLISVVNLVKSLQSTVRADRINDMFSVSILNKVSELESSIVTFGNQRLMACGINTGAAGMMQPMSPFNANMSMNNQPMPYPSMSMYQMPQYQQPMPQYQQPPMPQYQPQMPQAPMAQHAPPPPPPPPPPPQQPQSGVVSEPKKASSSSPAAAFALPGLGGGSDEKAAGRDYLLKLLSEK